MSLISKLDPQLQTAYPNMVAWRRYLHQNPELSFQEKETSRWIAERLRETGCEVREGVGGYGIVASVRGSKPGPAVALRTDFDALPIQDEKTTEYASKVPGVMHACGHDAHTATMLAIAAFYQANKDQLAGERRFIFQPAEEVSPGGAIGMIADGALAGIDAVYGVHLWTPLPYGLVATRSGPFMAAPDEIYIEITGKGGHGALPHETIDAVLVGSAMVQALQTIISRSVNPLDPAVVTIGSFHAGSTANVIAERCKLVGTVRDVLGRGARTCARTARSDREPYGGNVWSQCRARIPERLSDGRERREGSGAFLRRCRRNVWRARGTGVHADHGRRRFHVLFARGAGLLHVRRGGQSGMRRVFSASSPEIRHR